MEENKQVEQTQEPRRIWLGVDEIMERYGCRRSKAYDYIRAIRAACNGGKLGQGKVLMAEVEYWENDVVKVKVRL